MVPEFKIIEISNIQLDQQNPRFSPVSSQREALLSMIEEQGDKIFNLASDIAEHGLNPSARMIVFKEGGYYIDGDGNRRLTALKILETPDLIREHKLHAKFKKLSQDMEGSKIEQVDCVVFSSRQDARHWLEINHGGVQEGRGQTPWSSEQKERFNKVNQSIGLQAKEKLLESGLISDEEIKQVNITTLTRLLESKPGKKELSIEVSNGQASFNNLSTLSVVYKALIGKTVKEVYHDKDRKEFLKKALEPVKEDEKKTVEDPKPIQTQNQDSVGKRKTPRTKDGEKPFFGENLILKPGKVNDLYRDICELYDHSKKTGHFLEILGFSMRLILEVAAKEYYSQQGSSEAGSDSVYKKYLKLIKDESSKNIKNGISLWPDVKGLLDEGNVEALLGKLAHGNILVTLDVLHKLSFAIGPILKIHFSKGGQ